jgi:hypothetical protein
LREITMAKAVLDGGQAVSDERAAGALAQGHPKSAGVATAWGMKDQTVDNDGPDDDAREQSFNKGEKL